ncbi:T9SS C-terminal target domain-containing protein [Flavobacteriaceae bacterium MHTCC 0001]
MIFRVLFIFFSICQLSAQITLTHNLGNIPIDTGMPNCDNEEYWARTFNLSEYGILPSEQFIIKSGQVAISNAYEGAIVMFNIYTIDSNFPNSTPKAISYGNYTLAPLIGEIPEIITINFSNPVVVPTGTTRILIEVTQGEDIYNPHYKDFKIAGTLQGKDVSWFLGCREYYTYTSTEDLKNAVPNANFYINVTGETSNVSSSLSTTILSHNVCDKPIKTNIHSCSYSKIYWARLFNLEDFGVSENEEYIIDNGQLAVRGSNSGTAIKFNIYEVDDNFPDSFSETNLIGSSQEQRLPYIGEHNPRIINVDFESPIIIPNNVKKVLVEVEHIIYWGSGVFFMAGTLQDNDLSWQRGCTNVIGGQIFSNNEYVSTDQFGVSNANFFINVSGHTNHVTDNFEMNVSNICSEFLKEFSVEKAENIASIVWGFGDPASGLDNTSTDLTPYHDFSTDGIYTITAKVTGVSGSIEILTETIDVKEPPNAYGIPNIESCEDMEDTGISSSFNTSNIRERILGGQIENKVVTFIDGNGREYTNIPNPFTNNVKGRETITVRVARSDESCCYSETTFDLIVNPLPKLSSIENEDACDYDNNGIAFFDLSEIKNNILSSYANAQVEFYHENGTEVSTTVTQNINPYEEEITIRVTPENTNCYNESKFKLIVNKLPQAYTLPELSGCDDNGDGISEYFDFSNVEKTVLENQTGMIVSYFDSEGNELHIPENNLFTNLIPFEETLVVRVTNPKTNCFSEIDLLLKTSTKPIFLPLQDIYACNEDNGFSTFDLSDIQNKIIGDQSNLNLYYFNEEGIDITNQISNNFNNSKPWAEKITVRAENVFSPECFSETKFHLHVNELPEINLKPSYFLCNLEPSLMLSSSSGLSSWEWTYQDGTVISTVASAIIKDVGTYSLKVFQETNSVICENSFQFELIRSTLPKIVDVKLREFSDNNSLEIIATGDGDFEYSINGDDFQDSPLFNSLLGGVYEPTVRDKLGCGEDSREVVLLDYPKFFTPNNDSFNDIWHVKGLQKFPEARIFIYDRYGKLIKQISANSVGWNGTFNGRLMEANDYWFVAELSPTRKVVGHFALKL